ncbi:hypothetical protein B0I37DRAFT_445502 [Chaetomium sp. MPI-CAGE-AT-0009]|nr:hypothetical protein B0I37DRAFT_445502 [Chaetomium sp. MPI-CAGE-AT-0009]
MELAFPYLINPQPRDYGVQGPQSGRDWGTIGFVQSTYFGVPGNPKMQALRDLIDNRLVNIRNGLDIDGNLRPLPLFDQPLDPAQLIYTLQKALELCGEICGFEDSCLSIWERRHSEAMAILRAGQGVGVLALMTEIKQLQIQEATMAIATVQEAPESHVSTLKGYLALMGESKNAKIRTATEKWEDFMPSSNPGRMSRV